MKSTQTGWSKEEKQIAENVLAQAYKTELDLVINYVRQKINDLKTIDELWQIHDFLSARRYDLDGKYDSNESMLVFTFAQLVKEKIINLDDLNGLDKGKLAKISSLTKM